MAQRVRNNRSRSRMTPLTGIVVLLILVIGAIYGAQAFSSVMTRLSVISTATEGR